MFEIPLTDEMKRLDLGIKKAYVSNEILFIDKSDSQPIQCAWAINDLFTTIDKLRQILIDTHEYDNRLEKVEKFCRLFLDECKQFAEAEEGTKQAKKNTVDYSSLPLLSVHQAARIHEGPVKVKGVISLIQPLTKLVTSFQYVCRNCGQAAAMPGVKWADDKPAIFQSIKEPSKCINCEERTFNSRCKHISAILIEIRDLENYSEIDPLKAVLFEEDTNNVYDHIGEAMVCSGEIYTASFNRHRSGFNSYLYIKSIKYESEHKLVITKLDEEAIHRFTKLKGETIVNILSDLFARDIIGYNFVKKGLLLSAASTNKDINKKKINIILIGDPGKAKTTFIRKSVKLVPNSKYESAQNSSGKSLTAIVEKEGETHSLRIGSIPNSKGAICGLNEAGRMDFNDQKHLLDVLSEQFFTINKHGISAKIECPTAIIVSANPKDGVCRDEETIDLDDLPFLRPLIDRFDLTFTFRNTRDEGEVRSYADSKFDQDDALIPDYTPYLQKHIEYSKRFEPKMSEEAKFMLKEYYISIAKKHGSPRIRETIITIAKMIARIKLKCVIDAADARETMEFYNVILQQLGKLVNVVTDPKDEVANECLNIYEGSPFAMAFEDVIKSVCVKNQRVRYYVGEKTKLRDNHKLEHVIEKVRSNSHIFIVKEKPMVFRWIQDISNKDQGTMSHASHT